MGRSVECQCDHSFTCGYCLRNAPPYFFTPRTWREIIHDQIGGNPCTTEAGSSSKALHIP